MAKKSSNNGGLRRYDCREDSAWGGFINIRVTADMVADFEEWDSQQGALWPELLEQVTAEGIKVGVSYDVANQCSIVSFSGALVASGGARYSTNSRARDFVSALRLMLWKHFFVARGDYGAYQPRTGDFSWG